MDHGENDYYIWMEREGWRETDREKEIKVRRQTEKRGKSKERVDKSTAVSCRHE
jgi:hypothetical protein